MGVIEGAAAFSVVMMALSTIVTGVAEAFLRLMATRQKVLVEAVERLIVDEIVPAAGAGLHEILDVDGDGRLSAADIEKLKTKLTLSPLAAKAARIPFAEMRFGHERITTYALLQRLAKSELGDALARAGRAELRAKLTDIARTYERYAAAAAERFRYKAHRYTAIIAVLFAFAANVDAGRVFMHLMDDPGARRVLMAQAEALKAENDAAIGRLGAAAAGEAAPDAAAPIGGLAESLAEYRREARLPIGPGYYPYCGSELSERRIGPLDLGVIFTAENCAGAPDRTLFGWLAYTLLAGALIGLGGPFWYRIYAALGRLIGAARSLGGGEVIDEKAGDQPASKRALTDEDIVTTFEIARAGRPAAP